MQICTRRTPDELSLRSHLINVYYEPVTFSAAPNGSSLEFVFGIYSMSVAMR